MSQLMFVSLDKIQENPVALRQVDRSSEAYLELVESVKVRGVLNPINVRKVKSDNGDEVYGLVDGLHRTSAARDAGLAAIPAQIIDMDDAEVLEAQIIANVHKIETKPAQYSKQLIRILNQNPLMTLNELATKLGKSHAWLNTRLSLNKLNEKIQGLVDEGKVNLTNAYALSKLPEEEQVSFLDNAMTMGPNEFVPTVNNRVKELKDSKKQGRAAGAAEFVPAAYLQKASTIKEELASPKVLLSLLHKLNVKTREDAVKLALEWVLHLDADSVEVARQKWEAARKEREDAKARRQAEKQKDAAETAVDVEDAE
jgi:ParB/RepB/Spo0J family partition protein